MSDQALRQPRTFWQWLTNQPGTIFVPKPPAPQQSALNTIERELVRIHRLLDDLKDEGTAYINGPTGQGLISKMDKLHGELIRRSTEEVTPKQ